MCIAGTNAQQKQFNFPHSFLKGSVTKTDSFWDLPFFIESVCLTFPLRNKDELNTVFGVTLIDED